jgi:hypothetical protein
MQHFRGINNFALSSLIILRLFLHPIGRLLILLMKLLLLVVFAPVIPIFRVVQYFQHQSRKKSTFML